MGSEITTDPTLARPEAGFTLIELLVTVTLLAILSLGAVLALPDRRGGRGSDISLFQRQFDSQRALAISGQQTRGLHLDSQGMAPVQRGDEGWPTAPRALPWRGRVSLSTARLPGRQGPLPDPNAPELLFLRTGQTTAFQITFGRGNASRTCRSDGWTGVQCDPR